MPKFLVPRRSGVHRIAGVALFRALLRQSQRLPVDPRQRLSVQNVIRNTFKRNARIHSKRLLENTFIAGYQALNLLDAAVASNSSSPTQALLTLLHNQTASHLLRPARTRLPAMHPLRRHLPRKVHATKSAKNRRDRPTLKKGRALTPIASPDSLLNTRPRPFMSLRGPRKIPVLVSANGIPLLRFKKPQPDALGAYVRRRIKKRQRLHDLRDRLEEWTVMGKREDEWDKLVRDKGVEPRGALSAGETGEWDEEMEDVNSAWVRDYSPSTFEGELRKATRFLGVHLNDEIKRNRTIAARMEEIIRKEKILAKAEKNTRQRWRKQQASADKGERGSLALKSLAE